MNILVTGGAGFIGSNFISYFLKTHNERIVNLDKLTYAGSLSNLTHIQGHKNYTFVQGDICDTKLVDELFQKYKFIGIIHFAAESHVDNSIEKPDEFIQTNIFGTFNLLNTAKNYWMDGPNKVKEGCEINRFLLLLTDKVLWKFRRRRVVYRQNTICT